MTDTARIVLEVTAGMIPGRVEPGTMKRWVIASEPWYKADDAGKIAMMDEQETLANEYAKGLRNPSVWNWVRVDWVYL